MRVCGPGRHREIADDDAAMNEKRALGPRNISRERKSRHGRAPITERMFRRRNCTHRKDTTPRSTLKTLRTGGVPCFGELRGDAQVLIAERAAVGRDGGAIQPQMEF